MPERCLPAAKARSYTFPRNIKKLQRSDPELILKRPYDNDCPYRNCFQNKKRYPLAAPYLQSLDASNHDERTFLYDITEPSASSMCAATTLGFTFWDLRDMNTTRVLAGVGARRLQPEVLLPIARQPCI